MTARVGIIAGQGTLPFLVARGMRAAGREVFCVGLRGQFEPTLRGECDRFHEAGVLQLGRWIRLFRRAGVTEVTMVGRVSKKRMHDPWMALRALRDLPDWRTANLWFRTLRHDRRSATLLRVVADDLATSHLGFRTVLRTPGP